MVNIIRIAVVIGLTVLLCAPEAQAERLCDSSTENCRTQLLNLIRDETQGIDAAFWFMEDSRFSTELIRR